MAKIALVGYGSDGRGLGRTTNGYAYMVNDNVNKGDKIQVVSTNWKSGKKFATTAVPHELHRENSMQGQLEKSWAESESRDGQITTAYSGSQLGVGGFRGDKAYQQRVRAQNLQMYLQQNPQYEPTRNGATLIKNYGNPKGAALRKFLS